MLAFQKGGNSTGYLANYLTSHFTNYGEQYDHHYDKEINMTKKVHKESSDAMSKLASRALRGEKLTDDEIKSLAGCVLTQDQTKGKRTAKKNG